MSIAAVNYQDTIYSEATMEPEVISRWLSDDPLRQYASPYVGMGNDPINQVDPTGGVSGKKDEWTYNVNTEEWNKISDLGGSETQFVHYVYEGAEGGMVSAGNVQVFSSDQWGTFINANPSFLANNATGYVYNDADLQIRAWFADHPKNPLSIALWNWEQAGNFQPLTRQGFYDNYVSTYNTNSSFIHAAEGGYISSIGALGTGSNSLGQVGKPGFARASTMGRMGKVHGARLSPIGSRWNRFLNTNKGKYSGPNWHQQARSDYYNLIGN